MSELWHQRTATGRFGASPGKKCGFGCDFPSAGANNRMTAHVATAVGATKRKPMTTPALQERFQALMDEHKKILYKVCNSYCRNRDDRDDLAQEIIIQVWRSFGKFDKRYRFSTWMYRIALNVAISFYRRESYVLYALYSKNWYLFCAGLTALLGGVYGFHRRHTGNLDLVSNMVDHLVGMAGKRNRRPIGFGEGILPAGALQAAFNRRHAGLLAAHR